MTNIVRGFIVSGDIIYNMSSQEYDPLSDSEVFESAKEFFPKFDIVHRQMPENCTVEDTLKVMETVCNMAQKRRKFDTPGVGPFGFNKNPEVETKED